MSRSRASRVAVLLLLSSALLPAGPAQAAEPFDLRRQDQQLHLTGAYGVSLSGSLVLKKAGLARPLAVLCTSALTLAALSAKELYMDERYSQGDQAANVAGVLLNAGAMLTFEF